MRKFVTFTLFTCLFSAGTLVLAEDDLPTDDDDDLDVDSSIISSMVSYAHESLADYLTEEEDSDRINSGRFRFGYGTDEKSAIPWSTNITGTNRDYATRPLDNRSIGFKARIGKVLPERNDKPWTQNVWLKYRGKRYEETKTNSFNQGGAKYTVHYLEKKKFKITGSAGFDQFQYTESSVKDLSRFVEKLTARRFLYDEKVKLQAGYRREDLLQNVAGRKKSKNEYQLAGRWAIEQPALHMIKVNTTGGYRDAKDEEGNDKDLDFWFNRTKVRLDHRPFERARVYNSFEYLTKDYKGDGEFDNKGFEVLQGWKITPFKAKGETMYFNVVAGYKKFNYKNQNDLDFQRTGIAFDGVYRLRGNMKATAGLGYDYRNQRDELKDRNDYSITTGLEKKLLNELLEVGLELGYSRWDYVHRGARNLYKTTLNLNYKI